MRGKETKDHRGVNNIVGGFMNRGREKEKARRERSGSHTGEDYWLTCNN